MSKSTNPFLKGVSGSSDSNQAGDDGLIEISQRLDQSHLEGSLYTDHGAPIFAWAENHPKKTEENTHGSSPNLLNNHITTGRDTNLNLNSNSSAYHVAGNLIQVTNRYEESVSTSLISMAWTPLLYRGQQTKAKLGLLKAEETIDVAAGMLIPAPPPFILERDSQHSQIVAKLLSISNAKVAILGMGGIGKTTLACSIANDCEIVEAYPRRLFVSFEGCSTPDLAYTNLASAFNVPADRRSSHGQVLSQVLNYLKQEKTLLIIDNFETFWEVFSNRRAAEDFLVQVAALPKLALIVTLRGIQRPRNILWLKIEPLQTLTHDAAKKLLSIITEDEYTKDEFEYIRKLLDAVAGIPLAVMLIASLLRDGSETPMSLWHQWTRESARAIRVANEIDSDDRLYKLDISLRLSIFGPRMSANAKEVLAAVSILPIGLNMDEEWLDDFQILLGDKVRIRDCIRTLRDVALAVLDPSTSPPRLRLLPPVRDFCLNNLPLDGELARTMIDIYNTHMRKHWNFGLTEHYNWATVELSNINATLNHAIILCYVTDDFGPALNVYTEWRRFLCIPETDTVEHAIDILSEHPLAKAKCLQAFGFTLSEYYREQEAIQALEHALSIYRELEDKGEVVWTLYILGRTYRLLKDYTHAEQHLSEARDLVTEVDNKWNKGAISQALANIYFKQYKLPQAESTAKEALELTRASHDRRGEVNALRTLGDVYEEQGKYDLAIETLTAARDASQATHDTYMEACTNHSLGFVHRKVSRPDQAALHFRLAVPLFEQAQAFKWADKVRAILIELETSPDMPNGQ